MLPTIWASSRENLSSGFPTKRVSNQSPQLLRLARKLKFHLYQVYIYNTFQKANYKGADQSALMCRLVCTCVVRNPSEDRFSHDEAHMYMYVQTLVVLTCKMYINNQINTNVCMYKKEMDFSKPSTMSWT